MICDQRFVCLFVSSVFVGNTIGPFEGNNTPQIPGTDKILQTYHYRYTVGRGHRLGPPPTSCTYFDSPLTQSLNH